MFSRGAYENAAADGVAVLEIVEDRRGPEEARRFVPLKRTRLCGEVVGPLASLRLTQVYGYSREECPETLEAVYRFPLPGDAAVTGVRVQFGEVEIRTELKERSEAEAEYQEATRAGRQAALLSRESPDVFSLQVAGIQPDQDVVVETSYVQLSRAESAGWSLRIPLTTAPRYVRGDEIGARAAQPLLLLRDPGHRFSLELRLFGAGSVSSSTHALDVSQKEDHLRVSLREGEVLPDRDCVLSWQPPRERDQPAFHVWLHEDAREPEVYFLALVAPPAVPAPGPGIPREVILLVDHSGSMRGPKWAAADWAVKKFLSELGEGERFALGLFHNQTRWLSRSVRPANAGVIEEAVRFLEEHRDSGGTELGVALEQALHLERAEGELARHVLVITDAEVTDAGRILRLADQEASRRDRRRISVLCIDAAPNSFLAVELAERGGGVARFLTSDPEAEDIATALDEVLADWGQPVLTGLELEVDRPGAQAIGRGVRAGSDERSSRIDLGDLPTGRAAWVIGRAPRGETPVLIFRVLAPPEREVKARRVDLAGKGPDRPALKALFGARRVLALESLIQGAYDADELAAQLSRLGYDPESVLGGGPAPSPKVYAENRRRDSEAALRELLVRESLSSGLISSETAFIAVRQERGKPAERTVVVANALPAGRSEDFLSARFMHAAGSTGAAGPILLGAMAAPPAGVVPDEIVMEAADAGPMAAMDAGGAAGAPAGFRKAGRPSARMSPPPEAKKPVLFAGVPRFEGGEALLFDSARDEDAGKLADWVTISGLTVHFPGGAPEPAGVDPGLALLIYVEDLAQARARIRLADLIRQRGERPLNLLRQSGQRVRIVLVDPSGAWAAGGPQIEVVLKVGDAGR